VTGPRDNETWARNLAAGWLPGEPFRWELYAACLKESLDPGRPWCDLGSGSTDFVEEFAGNCSFAVGLDRVLPQSPPRPFVRADLERLPFRDGAFGTLSLRFVAEHLPDPGPVWAECARVLVPGSRLVLITTNLRSPLVRLASSVPHRLKRKAVSALFGVAENDVLPVYHRWNSPARIESPPPGFEVERIEYCEALDWHRRTVFLILLAVARLTRREIFRRLRSNVIAVYRRTGERA